MKKTLLVSVLLFPAMVYAECVEYKIIDHGDRVEAVCVGKPLTAKEKEILERETLREQQRQVQIQQDQEQQELRQAELKQREAELQVKAREIQLKEREAELQSQEDKRAFIREQLSKQKSEPMSAGDDELTRKLNSMMNKQRIIQKDHLGTYDSGIQLKKSP